MGRKLGHFIAFAALAGVAAAAVSYYRQYSDFHKDLEEDFHEFEDEDDTVKAAAPNRNYVSLNADKDEFTVAAKGTLQAAKGMASSACEVLKDVGHIIADNMKDGSSTAGDSAGKLKEGAKATAEKVKSSAVETAGKVKDVVKDAAGKLKKAPADASADETASETKPAAEVKPAAEDIPAAVKKATNIQEEDF